MSINRQSNFELLRIVCALMIIAGHIIMAHGYGVVGSISYVISLCLRPWFSCAVNTFVLLSGYFGIKTNTKKLWHMNDMVTFYSVCLLIVANAWGGHSIDPKHDFLFLFPVLTKKYWFITVYFALCMIAPALNAFIEKADKALQRKTIITIFCLFVVVPTLGFLLNFGAIEEDAGYGIVNFSLLYLIGRYLRIHGTLYHYSTTIYLMSYIGSMVGCGLFQFAYSSLLGFPFTSFLSYNTIFIFIGSLALLGFFSKIKLGSNRIINRLSSFSLCSYVIHLHPLTFQWFFCDILCIRETDGFMYFGAIFLIPIFVYILCAALETVRRYILNVTVYRLLP